MEIIQSGSFGGLVDCGFAVRLRSREQHDLGRQAVDQGQPPEPGTPEGDLAEISALIEEGKNKKAVKAVDRFLISHAASPVCEEAINLAGKAQT